MKNTILNKLYAKRYTLYAILIALLCLILPPTVQAATYNLNFSSYIGGSGVTGYEHARDVFVDAQGYIYVVGGTNSPNFPTTPGLDTTFDSTGTRIGSNGYSEAFVTKINPNSGQIAWSTFLGGPNYDRAYAVEVDDNGYVYVAGRAGPGFPTTPGVFQETFHGTSSGAFYGAQNGFVAKISAGNGSVIWASYVGIGELCRDLDIDSSGDIYVPLVYNGGSQTNPSWFSQAFANAYQKTRKGGKECGAVKIKNDGTQVLWATWFGGSGDEATAVSLRLDNSNNVYLALYTNSPGLPDVSGTGYYNDGKVDFYVAKLSSDGSNLEYGTYLGGAGDQWTNTHILAVDNNGNAYVSVNTPAGYPITNGVFQGTYGGGSTDIAITKLNSTGHIVASTFIGGSGGENPDGIYVDATGNVFISGETNSNDFPVTSSAYQSKNNGGQDAVIIRLSADFKQLLYSTYMGGANNDHGRSGYLGSDGSLYLVGQSDGPGWPVLNAFQPSFAGGSQDGIVAKFTLEGALLYGDVSGDSQISAYDAALAAHIAVGLSHPDIQNPSAAEVSGDGEVSAYDAALIAQRAVGLISKFPVEG